jgi:cytochrome c oxidase subunit 2
MEEMLKMPPVASAHGAAIDHSIVTIHWLMFALFAGWGLFYLYTLVRFRGSAHPKANYAGAKSMFAIWLAGIVAVFELTMLFTVDAPLWAERVAGRPADKDAVVVRVVAEQFAWNVHYPGKDGKFGKASISLVDAENPLGLDRNDPDAKDDIVTLNQLNIPVHKPVIVYLTSKDVIHSFGLPLFRIKQDAVPGLTIPVWFEPSKTTDEIREEWRHTYSIADAMKKVKKVSLPSMGTVQISRGSAHADQMLMKDLQDKDGNALASKGDMLNDETITKLADAGIATVDARPMGKLDAFVAMDEVKNAAGEVIVAKGDALMEDAVSKLSEAGIREISARPAANMDLFVVMENYVDKSGAAIVSKGEGLSEEAITKLSENGINEIVLAPATPTEIACSQLCGLGHYRMRGYVTVQTPEAFQAWYDEQEASLLGTVSEEQTGSATPSDTTASATATAEGQH